MEKRLAQLQQQLDEERDERQRQGAEHDEELDDHEHRIAELEDGRTWLNNRLSWLEKRSPKHGRPPSKKRKKN